MLEFHKLGFPAACFRLCGSTSRKSETPVGDVMSMLSMMNYLIKQSKEEEIRLFLCERSCVVDASLAGYLV